MATHAQHQQQVGLSRRSLLACCKSAGASVSASSVTDPVLLERLHICAMAPWLIPRQQQMALCAAQYLLVIYALAGQIARLKTLCSLNRHAAAAGVVLVLRNISPARSATRARARSRVVVHSGRQLLRSHGVQTQEAVLFRPSNWHTRSAVV